MAKAIGLGKAIEAAAEKQGVTIEAIRARAGISNGTFYDMKRGTRDPKLETLRKLKKAGVRHPLVDAA